MPLIFYGNFPGAQTPDGKSRVGHGWIGGIDVDGKEFYQGAWPEKGGRMKYDEDKISFCRETVSLTVWVTPEKQMLARQVGDYQRWKFYDNCIDHVVKSLDAIGYPHPSFKPSPIGISDPAIFCKWIKEENKHIDPRFVLAKDDIVPYRFNSPQFRASTQEHSFVFEDKHIRRIFHNGEWYFSITDIIGVLTESSNPRRYWSDLKIQLAEHEGFVQLYEKIVQLKLESSDGKKYLTDQIVALP